MKLSDLLARVLVSFQLDDYADPLEESLSEISQGIWADDGSGQNDQGQLINDDEDSFRNSTYVGRLSNGETSEVFLKLADNSYLHMGTEPVGFDDAVKYCTDRNAKLYCPYESMQGQLVYANLLFERYGSDKMHKNGGPKMFVRYKMKQGQVWTGLKRRDNVTDISASVDDYDCLSDDNWSYTKDDKEPEWRNSPWARFPGKFPKKEHRKCVAVGTLFSLFWTDSDCENSKALPVCMSVSNGDGNVREIDESLLRDVTYYLGIRREKAVIVTVIVAFGLLTCFFYCYFLCGSCCLLRQYVKDDTSLQTIIE